MNLVLLGYSPSFLVEKHTQFQSQRDPFFLPPFLSFKECEAVSELLTYNILTLAFGIPQPWSRGSYSFL